MRIGFIGGWGHAYLSHFAGTPGVHIAATGDGHDNERARKRFTDAGAHWFDEPQAMFDTFQPDVVNIGAVFAFNGDCAAAALERDVPVVCEKPIAVSWKQYDRLVRLCDNHSHRVIVTEFPLRSERPYVAARRAVRDGVIGTVVLATAQKSYRFGDARPKWYGDRAMYGGSIPWVASHAIDYMWYVTGLRFTRVAGQHVNLSKPDYPGMEEITVSMMTLENGAPAVVHADYNRPAKAPTHGDDRLRIVGSKGILEVRDGRCTLMTHDTPPQDITDDVDPKPAADDMLDAALGKPSETYGTAASLYMAKALLHARDAADEGCTIDINGETNTKPGGNSTRSS